MQTMDCTNDLIEREGEVEIGNVALVVLDVRQVPVELGVKRRQLVLSSILENFFLCHCLNQAWRVQLCKATVRIHKFL
jgi:hypothetical protein